MVDTVSGLSGQFVHLDVTVANEVDIDYVTTPSQCMAGKTAREIDKRNKTVTQIPVQVNNQFLIYHFQSMSSLLYVLFCALLIGTLHFSNY